eukprot:c14919_g1_i2.p1 GENE.c14919_g1_i2~~c14919_g1_i2.p1  ORF type:complete len:244 (-),score=74.36 c14919_g1_i2:9-683(-)
MKQLGRSIVNVIDSIPNYNIRFTTSKPIPSSRRPLTEQQKQRTLILIKPDAVQRGIVGELISRFERKGYKMVGMKITNPSKSLAEKHYQDHQDKPFFQRACRFLCSGPVVAIVWEGIEVISTSRALIGSTNPIACAPGTIRGDYALHFRRNLIHAADSVESANREIDLWFSKKEVISWDKSNANWIYELPNAPIEFDPKEGTHPGHLEGDPDKVNTVLPFAPTY